MALKFLSVTPDISLLDSTQESKEQWSSFPASQVAHLLKTKPLLALRHSPMHSLQLEQFHVYRNKTILQSPQGCWAHWTDLRLSLHTHDNKPGLSVPWDEAHYYLHFEIVLDILYESQKCRFHASLEANHTESPPEISSCFFSHCCFIFHYEGLCRFHFTNGGQGSTDLLSSNYQNNFIVR